MVRYQYPGKTEGVWGLVESPGSPVPLLGEEVDVYDSEGLHRASGEVVDIQHSVHPSRVITTVTLRDEGLQGLADSLRRAQRAWGWEGLAEAVAHLCIGRTCTSNSIKRWLIKGHPGQCPDDDEVPPLKGRGADHWWRL